MSPALAGLGYKAHQPAEAANAIPYSTLYVYVCTLNKTGSKYDNQSEVPAASVSILELD
jgi:hypothetical protein